MSTSTNTARAVLWSGVFLGAGALHLLRPAPFDTIVPESVPGSARSWTILSGLGELALGATIALPSQRARAAFPAALFLAAVWPANIKMAWDRRHRSLRENAVVYARVPAQLPMIASVLKLR